MLDFLRVITTENKDGSYTVAPDFKVRKSKDLMIKGGDFYAVWDENRSQWSTDEDVALDYIDGAVLEQYNKIKEEHKDAKVKAVVTSSHRSKASAAWHTYCRSDMRENFKPLDRKIIFANETIKKEDYATRKLDYSLEDGDISAYEDLMNVLYSPSEKMKIEWGIGSVISGDSVKNEKFFVLYGAPGTGKGTVIKILKKLFQGYCKSFESKLLGSSSAAFPLEQFKDNPLVAFDPDGNLSKIDDNSRLNALVSHEEMPINIKHANIYTMRFTSLLFICTNSIVKITDAKSGLVRRMIEVTPTGVIVDGARYDSDMAKIDFELGAIAKHCLDVYMSNKDIYNYYIPRTMIGGSNPMYNFIEYNFDEFSRIEGITLKRAWDEYNAFCDDAKFKYSMNRLQFREELKNYFYHYDEVYVTADGNKCKQFYSGFHFDMSRIVEKSTQNAIPDWLSLSDTCESTLDREFSEYPAQYAETYRDKNGVLRVDAPTTSWEKCKTKLKSIDTRKVHYVKPPDDLKLIFYDFDVRDEKGAKNFELCQKKCIELGLKPSYAELSKGGEGLHVYYIYGGIDDLSDLSSYICENVELKICKGGSTLRRKLIKCNNLPIAKITSGLPLKAKKGGNVVNQQSVKSEARLKDLIDRALKKEFEPHHTAPSIDFINHILNEAYESGLNYDLTSMRNRVSAFAAGSSNQAVECLRKVNQMHFKSKAYEAGEKSPDYYSTHEVADGPIAFFDIEIFDKDPNDTENLGLFLVCYKIMDNDIVTPLFNPSPEIIDSLFIENIHRYRWIGYNNLSYDNHMVYGRYLGESPHELYIRSQRLINYKDKTAQFYQARDISYTDVLDFSSEKKSLKKFEIELKINHEEFAWEWDKPLPKELWTKAAEYCKNDVIATEAVFKARHSDFIARCILADLAEGTVNERTNALVTKFLVGNNRHPNLVYTDLSNEFPGYEFIEPQPFVPKDRGKNMYRGVDLGFGGYVYANVGYWDNVALLDVNSLHPHTFKALNYFGDATQKYVEILETRLLIKNGNYEEAKKKFDGKLSKYLTNEDDAADLAQALKIILNSTYGLSWTSYDNPLKHPQNKNNIIALRGALFMKTLQDNVEEKGYTVVHIKTDSIKIANADESIVNYCMEFAKKYGYTFDYEAQYEKMCLVNNAVYIAKHSKKSKDYIKKVKKYLSKHPDGKEEDVTRWTATGEQFAVPFIFKNLFSHEPLVFDDYCEVFEVREGSLYLDCNESLTTEEETRALKKEIKDLKNSPTDRVFKRYGLDPDNFKTESQINNYIEELEKKEEASHNYEFVGRIGQFTPVQNGCGGALLKVKNQGVFSYANGAKGYRWMESATVRGTTLESMVDKRYYIDLLEKAKATISKYCNFDDFVADYDFLNLPVSSEDEEVPFA